MVWYNPFTWFAKPKVEQKRPSNRIRASVTKIKVKDYPDRDQEIIRIYCTKVRQMIESNKRLRTEYAYVIPFFDLYGLKHERVYSLNTSVYAARIPRKSGYNSSNTFAKSFCDLLNTSGAKNRKVCVNTMRRIFNQARKKWLAKMKIDNVEIKRNNYIRDQLPPLVDELLLRIEAMIK